jgi:hypothetical protein
MGTLYLLFSTSIERMMEVLAETLPPSAHWRDYGEWDELFEQNLAQCFPVLNTAILYDFKEELSKIGALKPLANASFSCSFYCQRDYIGLFTLKITAHSEALTQLIGAVSNEDFCNVQKADQSQEPLIYDFEQPCSQWRRSGHKIPSWPPQILEEN